MKSQLAIFVFSFNRGIFLENCLHSIEQCLNGVKTVIVDDNSTDPDTRERLSKLSERYEIFHPRPHETEIKTGGLYANMNYALHVANSRGISRVLFIQDDMQLVRQFSEKDFLRTNEYFKHVSNSIQISTSFVRRLSEDGFLDEHLVNQHAHAYIRHQGNERGKSNFSATGIFHVQRFHELFGSLEVGEGKNSEKARQLGLTCGRSMYPFMCWLPYPESYRGKRKDIKHKFFEYFGHSGYYPIEIMSEESVAELLNRDPHILPIMERYLSAPTAPRADVWSTGGGEYNFICYNGVAAKVFMAIKSMKRRLQVSDP